ncbi:unnamed protein product [Acidithrix sp. C25]|nr:unnamed protein product [Acidithrix sp. C25]
MTVRTKSEPSEVVITFDKGKPTAIDHKPMDLVDIIDELNVTFGSYGFGRIDMVENRRVGIKSREVYEAPAALGLIMAHDALEDITLERDLAMKRLNCHIAFLSFSTTDSGTPHCAKV